MIEVTYSTFSKILGKTFINKKEVKSIEDFNTFSMALNLNAEILEIRSI